MVLPSLVLCFCNSLPITPAYASACRNSSSQTLADALLEQQKVDRFAQTKRTALERDRSIFIGWKVLPVDVKITGGPAIVTVIYTTRLRVLPDFTASAFSAIRPGYKASMACKVQDPAGRFWYVLKERDGRLTYVEASEVE